MPSKHDYHGTFGDGCHLEFQGGGAPVVIGDHGFKSHKGCATVSDANGQLLFYTDGDTLFDGADVPIIAGLGGSMSNRGAEPFVDFHPKWMLIGPKLR